jgi:hypothetical protein
MGGELSQEDAQGQLHPVAYFSRALTKRERSYPTYDRDVMAMRDTLKHFRYYLLGVQVVMRTDHKPLLKILEQKDPFGRRTTLMRDIAEFEPRIVFIRGQDNHMADALSRMKCQVGRERRGTLLVKRLLLVALKTRSIHARM